MPLLTILKQVELFRGLNADQLERIGSICRPETLTNGTVLFRQGEPSDKMVIIASGQVEIAVTPPNGEPYSALYLGKGQVVGEMGLIDAGARSATAIALGETQIYSIARADFEMLCETDTAIGYLMMRNLAQDLSFKLRHRDN